MYIERERGLGCVQTIRRKGISSVGEKLGAVETVAALCSDGDGWRCFPSLLRSLT
jgi:hypothetical protein